MEVEIANPIEIQEGDDEEIPLVRDDVEPDIVDADIVDANLVDAIFIQDDNDKNDEDVVSEDDEDDFVDKESYIDSFDRDLEEDGSYDDSVNASSQVVVSQNRPLAEGDITQNDAEKESPTSTLEWYFFFFFLITCLHENSKRGPTRGLKSLREREQNTNVKCFMKITPDMERVIGKNANRFIGGCSKWVTEFCPIDSRHKDGSWDPKAAAKYEEFKELHMSQIEKEGADNLSLKKAYLLVMNEKLGYHRGLGLVHNRLEKVELLR
ncbi:hypothetical protein Cgig2_007777 [Carnegiea gigantea]|uniref:Uncharacterized protein n=1 Tax=Carnegiea gigantea TaxID=171969 RepID=A0A9Q1K2B0_9CARY|nr:hypothetical protein Cgig2_007777 [Carnegiea gigantea]